MDPDTDVCQTEQPQISYSVDFTAEQSSAMGSPNLLDREGTYRVHVDMVLNHACICMYQLSLSGAIQFDKHQYQGP